MAFNTLIISSAVSAASAPLLPALVPARSIACSMLSVVRTPKATGIGRLHRVGYHHAPALDAFGQDLPTQTL
jgi:hypothetical protein